MKTERQIFFPVELESGSNTYLCVVNSFPKLDS
jgi:hypothetical protein